MFGFFKPKSKSSPARMEYKQPHPEWSSFVSESESYIAFSTMGKMVCLDMMEEMRSFGFKPINVATWFGQGRVIVCEKPNAL